jgi:hypothetical protein
VKRLVDGIQKIKCRRIVAATKPLQSASELDSVPGETVSKNNYKYSSAARSVLGATIVLLISSCAVSAQRSQDVKTIPTPAEASQTTTDLTQTQASPQTYSQSDPQKHKSTVDETVGVLSRKSIFFPELATNRNPLTPNQKFKLFVDKTIAPSTFIGATASAAYKQALDTYPGYGQGWDAYGKRYGAAIANSASTNFFGTFVFPTLFHEDPRHFFSERPGFGKKVEYALTRQVVTRKDDGSKTFNWSRVLSVLVAEGIANTYLPPDERTAPKTFERAGNRFAFGVASTLLKEYWPVIAKKLSRSHKSFGGPPGQP